MRYRRDYQETHDIDWFFRYKGKFYHAASNGGIIPDVIDSTINRDLQERLEEINGSYKVKYSQEAENRLNQNEDLSSFAEYASKGFISLDRDESYKEVRNCRYLTVAYPANEGVFSNKKLEDMMPELNDEDIVIV